MRGRAEDQQIFYTLATILREPLILATSGLRNFVALIHAQIMFILNFAKCVRARVKGPKIFFTLTSITREPRVVGSSTLRHFVAQSNFYSNSILYLVYCVSEWAQGPAINLNTAFRCDQKCEKSHFPQFSSPM